MTNIAKLTAILSPEARAMTVRACDHLEQLARCGRNAALLIESDPVANAEAIVVQLDRALAAITALQSLGEEHRELIAVLKP